MKENICKLINSSIEDVDKLLDLFIIEQKAAGELNRTLSELRRHFTQWAKKHYKTINENGTGKRTWDDLRREVQRGDKMAK